jgi:16S rRNA (uracil1498-N3)-methyltransferase
LLFDPAASREADAVLVDGPAPDVWCRVEALRPSGYQPLPIRLIQGLGKADKPDEVIRSATALGVARVTLVHTARSVARPVGERAAGRLERWRRIAIEASRQSGRGDIPALDGPLELGAVLSGASDVCRLMLAPDAEPLFERLATWGPDAPLELVVGPEGGFHAGEQHALPAAGFLPASLGTTTLRTELAGIAALGALVAWSALRNRTRAEAPAAETRE